MRMGSLRPPAWVGRVIMAFGLGVFYLIGSSLSCSNANGQDLQWVSTKKPLVPEKSVKGQKTSKNADPLRHRAAPESCVLYSSWEGFGKLDPNRSASEKWLSQQEIVQFGEKLEKALFQAIDFHLAKEKMESELPKLAATAGSHLLFSMVNDPGSFYVTEFRPGEVPKISFGVHVNLGERFDVMKGLSSKILKGIGKEQELTVTPLRAEGQQFFKLQIKGVPVPVFWCFADGHLHLVSAPEVWSDWKARSKTATPKPLSRWDASPPPA